MKCPNLKWTLERLGLIPVFFLFLFSAGNAQDLACDPVSIALGDCYVTVENATGGINNEAFLGYASNRMFYFSHARPFVIKELGVTSAGTRFPLFPGNMQVGVQHFGIPGFQQINTNLGYGMKLSDMIFAGIGFRYYNTSSLGEWSYLRALGLSGGILIQTDPRTLLAAHIVNPVTLNNYSDYGHVFPSLISFGVCRKVYEFTNIYTELHYNSWSKLQLKIAAEYTLRKSFNLRTGYHSNPNTLSLGSRLSYSKLYIDIAFSYSMRIGVMPALKISFIPGQ